MNSKITALFVLLCVVAGAAAWEIGRRTSHSNLADVPTASGVKAVAAPQVSNVMPPSAQVMSPPQPSAPEVSVAPPAQIQDPKPAAAQPLPDIAGNPRIAAGAPAAPADLPPIPEPIAREALNDVGVDPLAEEIWEGAINDPRLSAYDRQNLIEDLNENGFVDPDHVTQDELPLVVSRLALIEQLAPSAMDDTNAAAFQEAYKDLSKMYTDLTGS